MLKHKCQSSPSGWTPSNWIMSYIPHLSIPYLPSFLPLQSIGFPYTPYLLLATPPDYVFPYLPSLPIKAESAQSSPGTGTVGDWQLEPANSKYAPCPAHYTAHCTTLHTSLCDTPHTLLQTSLHSALHATLDTTLHTTLQTTLHTTIHTTHYSAHYTAHYSSHFPVHTHLSLQACTQNRAVFWHTTFWTLPCFSIISRYFVPSLVSTWACIQVLQQSTYLISHITPLYHALKGGFAPSHVTESYRLDEQVKLLLIFLT